MRKQFYISREPLRVPHEHLMLEDLGETTGVGTRARADYGCEHCGGTITKGDPHDSHKFYPEFQSYRTHKECSEGFRLSLRTDDDPDPYED